MNLPHAHGPPEGLAGSDARLWVERLRLTDFRNYVRLNLDLDPRPVVLYGANGAGKTNLLEAVSLLAPGQGLRGAPYGELARTGGPGGWAVAARVHGEEGAVDIGTGLAEPDGGAGRLVRIAGETTGPAALDTHVRLVWLTPALDSLFTGPAAERRRFLGRLIQSLDSGYRALAARFERAMRQRNRLLELGVRDEVQFAGLEAQIAEAGVALAALRLDAASRLAACIEARRRQAPGSPFPWARLELSGTLEAELAEVPAIDVEDAYRARLARLRERDRAAGRTIEGPHRSDLLLAHGPKAVPAQRCSTGEQKALLVGLVLAHAELVAQSHRGRAPLLLLDEVAAHLDAARRLALFDEIVRLGVQAWMTGTERAVFAGLGDRAQHFRVENGAVTA